MKKVYTLAAMILTLSGSQAFAQTSPGYSNRAFQYLTSVLTSSSSVSGTTQAWNAVTLPRFYSLSVSGNTSGFQVYLEGSLDGNNWSVISATTTVSGMTSNINPVPAIYLRLRAQNIPANTQITATSVGVW